MKSPIRILVAPLDWGLGHTTRCIPIIQQLQQQGASVTIAGNAAQIAYLQAELNDVDYLPLTGYDVTYAKTKLGLLLKLLSQIPKIMYSIYTEHQWLKQIQQMHHFDIIISDNRYGLFCKNVTTVFITHQLQIQVPFGSNIVQAINHYFIQKFTQCWVPDLPAPNSIAGALSANTNITNQPIYLGIISRFTHKIICEVADNNSILCILSGPEPQRSLLANSLAMQLANTKYTITIIGQTSQTNLITAKNITCLGLQSAKQIQALVATHSILISRSGYTTVMDLAIWQRSAILIPTPGQTEQEYLGQYLQQQQLHNVAMQNNINWQQVIQQYLQQQYIETDTSNTTYLPTAITQLLATIH